MGIGSSKVHPINRNRTGLMANNIVIDRNGLAGVPTGRFTPRVTTYSGTGANPGIAADNASSRSPRSSLGVNTHGFRIQPFPPRKTVCVRPKLTINFRTPSCFLLRKTTVRVQPKENEACNSEVIDISEETLTEGEIVVDTPTEKIYVSKVKRWQIFPGNAKFWCDGRFIHGTDRLTFYASFSVIQIIFGSFAAFVLPFLMKVTPLLLLPFITALCYICVVSTMLYSAYTDPGIIPRSTKAEVDNWDKKFLETGFIPTMKEQINGKPYLRRWCTTCLFYKPPRATHCRSCDHCVERFDHHCPFIGNCVGQRNYPTFFMFLVAVIISCLYVIGCCCGVVAYEYASDMNNFYRPDKPTVASWIVGIATFAVLVAVGFLFGLHLGLISQDLTTNEDYKFDGRRDHNVFDQHSIWRNWCQVLCTPRLPSLIQRRAYVTQDFLDSLYYQEAVNLAISKKYGAAKDEPEPPKDDFNKFKIMPTGKDGKLDYPRANYHGPIDPTKEVAVSSSTHLNNNAGHTSDVHEINHLPQGPSPSLEESEGFQINAATNHTNTGHSVQQQDLRVSGFQLEVRSSETIDSLGDTANNVNGNHSLAQISIGDLELSREFSDPSLPFIISRETVLIHKIFSKQLLTPTRSREGPDVETMSLPINLVHHSSQSICRSFSCTQPTLASYASAHTQNPGISTFSSPAKDDIVIGVQMQI